jgi:hypothetical protein
MRFEEKKFCRISTLADRWDCSRERIYDLISKNVIRAWHPEGLVGVKGILIDVSDIIKAEYINLIHPE